MYKFSGFTVRANHAINYAIIIAEQMGHTYVGSEHLLLGLLREGSGLAWQILSKQKVSYDAVSSAVMQAMGRGVLSVLSPGDLTPHCKAILDSAAADGKNTLQSLADTEHILLAVIREQGCFARTLLANSGLPPESVGKLVEEATGITAEQQERLRRAAQQKAARSSSVRTVTLDKYSRDLTELARAGKLDPIIGREQEILRTMQILTRRTKNNPCLIGEPGVGKTAIAEGLAQRIVTGNAPEELLGCRLAAVDLTAMVAGTKYRGDFEERIRSMMEEVTAAGNVILFIDEIHTIMGIGAAEGAVDAANIMKPRLARGDFQVIGATTIAEYRKTIERDGALERRFQTVMVEEPSPQEAEAMLRGLRERYESHHHVRISEEAIQAAVSLSRRYDCGRFLPDKALDLIDEAASRERLDAAAQNRDCRPIGREEIARVVAQSTGIDLSQLAGEESRRLANLEFQLEQKVIGQHEAVESVCRAVRRSRIGLRDPARPIGSFLFLGPTGVGKTLLCRTLGEALLGGKDSLIRFDMSEYMEKQSVSRLIGAPPGYLGYDEGGQLTDKIRRHPYSVVLFDEIEKAHPDVMNLLLQVLEDGELTDSQGRKAVFRHAVMILTSNVGAELLTRSGSLGFSSKSCSESRQAMVMEEVRRAFRPEFLNRLDELVFFHSLGQEELKKIAALELAQVGKRLEGLGYRFRSTPQAEEALALSAAGQSYGARPLRRTVRAQVEDPVSDAILSGALHPGDEILCGGDGGRLSVQYRSPYLCS